MGRGSRDRQSSAPPSPRNDRPITHPGSLRRLPRYFGKNDSVNAFLQHERDSGLELLTWVNGGFRPRLTTWIREQIQDEIDAGHYRAPATPELLADGIVTIGERFLHHGGDPDVRPDPESAGRMIALLLREPCTPSDTTTRKKP